MLPVLQIGPLSLPVYPLALLAATWVGLSAGGRAARRLGLEADHVYNAGLYALVAGLVAGRLAHVVAYWPSYRTQLLEIFGFNSRAFLLWPGVIAALAVAGVYVHRHRLPWATFLDACAPGLLVAFAIAETGAFLAGRSPGAPTDVPWAISLYGVPRHPTQLYAAVAYLGIAALAWSLLGRARPGAVALISLLGFGLATWLLDPFRAPGPTILGGFRPWQILGLGLALLALWGLRPRAKEHTPLPPEAS